MKFTIAVLAFVGLGGYTNAFVAPGLGRTSTMARPGSISKSKSPLPIQTRLHVLPPPLIIGPMIKKMREDKAKKKMPLADESEAFNQAPGLRVGKSAWKWPPVWPYDDSYFMASEDADKIKNKANMDNVASLLSGVPQVPTADATEENKEDKFNALTYWAQKHPDTKTFFDADSAEKLKEHYRFYLKNGMSILEFGAAEDSFLPEDLQTSRHVGVGANKALMDQNPALSENMVVDLNNVVKGQVVNSDDLKALGQETFDAIIMSNTAEYLSSPKEVFRSAWYLLKPGGRMIVSFASKEASKGLFDEAQTKIWQDYNDDQHMWITGSFFQFSAGDGWEELMGFDISPESAKDIDADGITSIFSSGKNNNVFVVQAVKAAQNEQIDPSDVARSIKSLCWMLPVMEERDKNLVVPRLARAYERTENQAVRQAINDNVQHLPKIYESLTKMDQFSFTFSMQAQMAADLICDPDFNANDEQILALKRGLGLRSPDEDFWRPVGENTALIEVEDKISLLGSIVPCFGSGDPVQEDALQAFVSGLKPTFNVIQAKCPEFSASDVQLLGAEMLASEVLKRGRSTRLEYASWLSELSATEMRDLLALRKSIRQVASEELESFRAAKAAAIAEREEKQRQMDEQIANARETRSLIFNPKTQKMEVFDNPNKK